MDLQQHKKQYCLYSQKLKSKILKRSELRYIITFIFLAISYAVVSRHVRPLNSKFVFPFDFFSSKESNDPADTTSFSLPEKACDYSYGRWVRDDQRPLHSYEESCPFLDPGFRCRRNGRPDEGYLGWRWQPYGCDLPTFNAGDFLERSRNGRIVFVGDSLGRNQWESLLCMFSQAVTNKSTIYEVNGNPISKHKGFLSMRFQDYNVTVEYYRAPFLVVIGRPPRDSPKEVRRSIKLDVLHWFSRHWVGADVIVFNAGHWWNEGKTIDVGNYFEENNKVNMTMGVMEAFRRSLQTWKTWASSHLNPEKAHTFFRSYSPAHYSNGTWNQGGHCDTNLEPEMYYENLKPEPLNNVFTHDAVKQTNNVNRKVQFLNITYLTEFRRDGHPSMYREPGTPPLAPQDCSHWCLPGVPDTWNELLYANLLLQGFRTK